MRAGAGTQAMQQPPRASARSPSPARRRAKLTTKRVLETRWRVVRVVHRTVVAEESDRSRRARVDAARVIERERVADVPFEEGAAAKIRGSRGQHRVDLLAGRRVCPGAGRTRPPRSPRRRRDARPPGRPVEAAGSPPNRPCTRVARADGIDHLDPERLLVMRTVPVDTASCPAAPRADQHARVGMPAPQPDGAPPRRCDPAGDSSRCLLGAPHHAGQADHAARTWPHSPGPIAER